MDKEMLNYTNILTHNVQSFTNCIITLAQMAQNETNFFDIDEESAQAHIQKQIALLELLINNAQWCNTQIELLRTQIDTIQYEVCKNE